MGESFEDKILVVLPAYNEEGKIGRVVSNMPSEWVHEVVVVNDGSKDDTERESRDAGATLINQPRNMGVGAAIRTGIKHYPKRWTNRRGERYEGAKRCYRLFICWL